MALDVEKRLPAHTPVPIKEYSKDYYDIKSKLPFRWGNRRGERIIPWISFLGYQVRYDGIIRVRRKSIQKELEKQVRVVTKTIK
ncbi:MAG: hypothetical protein ACYS6K_24220 [Planctomycetota bacterium]|jgi:hypothetical protein